MYSISFITLCMGRIELLHHVCNVDIGDARVNTWSCPCALVLGLECWKVRKSRNIFSHDRGQNIKPLRVKRGDKFGGASGLGIPSSIISYL